ncbi:MULTISPECIES: hypothetical protein [unclassified Kitasatospora]|uniref:hypothetical protein n=1 Tax=unclassified Kitasatospora TaxID=2633591 RepID=UPI00071078C8|nr:MULTISPECIES: hypothetical protein [unclassified Kitasatospora]KQV12042.1 hypothetical protein ASC99_35025 [Kitasatospora sp. Root107]KRB72584.1 hypothetical protein ASE03_22365 [Kitasatospora sp. Root187]
MPPTSREARLRRLAERLGTQHRTSVEPLYDPGRQSWTLRWYDGPAVAAVRSALEQDGPENATVLARRDLTTRALALAAIRETRAGAMHRWVGNWGQRYHLEQMIGDRPYPERTIDHREEQMLTRLLTAATLGRSTAPDENRAFELIARDGIAWLLPEQQLADPGRTDGLALAPIEFLTARYATAEHRSAWETALTPMPLEAAVAAVRADPDAPPEAARAALALLPTLRATLTDELDRAESALARVATEG